MSCSLQRTQSLFNDQRGLLFGPLLDDPQKLRLRLGITLRLFAAFGLQLPVARQLALQLVDLFQRAHDQPHGIDRRLQVGTRKLSRRLVATLSRSRLRRLAKLDEGGKLLPHLRRHLVQHDAQLLAGRRIAGLRLKKIFLHRSPRLLLAPAANGLAAIDTPLRPEAAKLRRKPLDAHHANPFAPRKASRRNKKAGSTPGSNPANHDRTTLRPQLSDYA